MSETEPNRIVSSRRLRCTWLAIKLSLLAAVAVAVVYWGMGYRGEQRCRKWLGRFPRALAAYLIAANGHLPPAYLMDGNGRRMHSWRACLIPFVDSHEYSAFDDMYKFDEPWDSPANTRFRNETGFHEYYSCPVHAEGSLNTSYLCVIGGALWPVPKVRCEDWNVRGSPRWRNGGMLPSRGKAILLVEVVKSDIPWTKPEDITLLEIASLLREDPSGDQFRRCIRHVLAVDPTGGPSILDPGQDIEEIRAILEAEISTDITNKTSANK